MYIPMLEAVSEMLANKIVDPMKEGIPPNATRVHCAKIMLDKIIEGMKAKPLPPPIIVPEGMQLQSQDFIPVPAGVPVEVKPKRTGKEPEVEYDHVKKVFTSVKNAPPNNQIEINGYIVDAKLLIGKSLKDVALIGKKVVK